MKSIYEASTLRELTQRIDLLKPDTQRQWGKMDVGQMMAHCSAALEISLGDKPLKRSLMGILIGGFARKVITDEKPFKQNMPTVGEFIVRDAREFDKERQRLKVLLTRMSQGGMKGMENRKHPFFGPLTPMEWSNSQFKHLDHHLRQFGV